MRLGGNRSPACDHAPSDALRRKIGSIHLSAPHPTSNLSATQNLDRMGRTCNVTQRATQRNPTLHDEPDFASFGHDDAWELGTALVARCRAEQLAVTISIHLGAQRVFHAALPGTAADNDEWTMRKTRIVQRFGRSSQEVGQTCAADGPMSFHTVFGLSAADYAPTGGAIPIRIHGTMIGVLAVSGLTSAEDHDLAVTALQLARNKEITTNGSK